MPYTRSPRSQMRRKVLLALFYVGIGAFIIGAVVLGIGTFQLVDAIRETQKTNASTNATILDCTKPEGKCAKKNQEQIGEVVNNIGRLSVYASACAAEADPSLPVRQRAQQIETCVRELVEDPPASPGVP